MLQSSNDVLIFAQPYIDEFNLFCIQNNLIGKVQADHIGLKCSTHEIYERQRMLFEFEGIFVYQSIISKRRISIIGLRAGLATKVGELRYLELSDQKPDGSQKDCIDHHEIVPTGISYDELIVSLQKNGVVLKEIVA